MTIASSDNGSTFVTRLAKYADRGFKLCVRGLKLTRRLAMNIATECMSCSSFNAVTFIIAGQDFDSVYGAGNFIRQSAGLLRLILLHQLRQYVIFLVEANILSSDRLESRIVRSAMNSSDTS
jgi:hypothetical protein